MTYEIIKRNYDKKLWSKKMVAIAVVKGVITDAQYKEITGEDYVAPASVPKSTIQTMQAQITALQDQATQGGKA